MGLFAAIGVSLGGLIIGLLVAVLIYVIAVWLAGEAGQPIIRIVGAIIAVIVFLVAAFDFGGFYSDEGYDADFLLPALGALRLRLAGALSGWRR